MRDLILGPDDCLDVRADELVISDTPTQFGYRNVVIVNDEDFARDKEEKLHIRKQKRKQKHACQQNAETWFP